MDPGLALCAPRDDGVLKRECIRLYARKPSLRNALHRITNDLSRKVAEHKTKAVKGFTAEYGVDRLVWWEIYERVDEAILREKALKKWRRDWKIRLIEADNPNWLDLHETLNR